ncbi:DUF1273 domain-containing protein [Fructilactobacillus sp. Tb1]|uniref:DUF1273 domain-containing protein n=1 Tax=Fructilactobacillus sp. Tb1 TaxID=3422304 RepID=UPI003D2B628D
MSRVWITGYRTYEIGIFNQDDKKLKVIKRSLKETMINLIENGCDWIITGAQLGTEQWVIEIAHELKKDYQFQLAVILPFEGFGKNWNENNQMIVHQLIQSADFSAYVSQKEYESPQQLKNYQQFMLTHTDKALFLYDTENEGKTIFDYNAAHKYQNNHVYPIQQIELDDLQDTANEMAEESKSDYDI